jgi:hypothetical protein
VLLTQRADRGGTGPRGRRARALGRAALPHVETNLGPFHPLTVEAKAIAAAER